MKYMGSKLKIAKYILPIILSGRKTGQWYVEAFIGGCNTIDKVDGNRIGADLNKYLIAMWKGLQDGSGDKIYDIPKELYDLARIEYRNETNDRFTDFEIGWIGFVASRNGRFFDGGYSGKHGGRNYIDEQIRNIEKQVDKILGINFCHCSYEKLNLPPGSIVYCDPPYRGVKQYDVSKDFDYDKFWQWCRDKSAEGHSVFVSEVVAPSDFKCVWEMSVVNSSFGGGKPTGKLTQRLFKFIL
jgi:DNA adenine methylase